MIDWWNLLTNLLWISGLAVALAVFSHADWRASLDGHGLPTTASRTLKIPLFLVGGALTCLGAGLSVAAWWKSVLWLVLAIGLALHAVRTLRRQQGAAP